MIQNISRDSETDVREKTQVLQKNKNKKNTERERQSDGGVLLCCLCIECDSICVFSGLVFMPQQSMLIHLTST